MRASILILVALTTARSAEAHDFWIQPSAFAVAPGGTVPLLIEVGHGSFRQRWSVNADRVASFVSVGPGGSIDRRRDLHLDGPASDADLRFDQAGTHVIALVTTPALSNLPGIRFTDYARTEGLTPALAARAAAGTADRPGRERYSRRAKALVQVGTGGASAATRPLGMTLEIVPERDPYALKPGEALPVRIVYEGKPLAGATVKLNNLDFDAKPVRIAISDPSGRTAFAIPFRGLWQLNVIWTKPIVGDADADFDTVFSSLTFSTAKAGQAVEGR